MFLKVNKHVQVCFVVILFMYNPVGIYGGNEIIAFQESTSTNPFIDYISSPFQRWDLNISEYFNETFLVYDVYSDSSRSELWFSALNEPSLFQINLTNFEIERVQLSNSTLTPLMLEMDEFGYIWFTDDNFDGSRDIDNIVRFNTTNGDLDIFPLSLPGSSPIELQYNNQKLYFTTWDGGYWGWVDAVSLETYEFELDCEVDTCDPLGLDIVGSSLYIIEARRRDLLKIDLETNLVVEKIDLPLFVKSPVELVFDGDQTLWMGAHGGDEFVAYNIASGEFSVYPTPKSPPDSYPISGLNDLRFDDRGFLWSTEHFVNRIAMMDTKNELVYEFDYERDGDSNTQWMDTDGELIFYAEYTGDTIGILNASTVPIFEITIGEYQKSLTPGSTTSVPIDVKYIDGIESSLNISGFISSLESTSISLQPSVEVMLDRDQSVGFSLFLDFAEDIAEGNLEVLIGIQGDLFSVSTLISFDLADPFTLFSIEYIGLAIALSFVMVIIVKENRKGRKS